MSEKKIIKVLKRKEKSFIHLPIEIPTILVENPVNNLEKIFLPEAFHNEFKNFISDKDPISWTFIKRGLDERHQDKNIRKYLIFSNTIKEKFDKFIEDFSHKYKIKIIIE